MSDREPGSTAQGAFSDALDLVKRSAPRADRAGERPAFDYVVPRMRAPLAEPDSGLSPGGPESGLSPGGPESGLSPGGPESGPRGGAVVGLIAAARRRMAAGELSASDLVEQAITAAEKHGAELGAVVELMADRARSEARRLDAMARAAGALAGPLHGIPITVKDVIHVAGVPTRAGSAAYYHLPSDDAVAVARARAAGAIVVAKVSTHEFALGVTTPQSCHPLDKRRIPGGSSGGSAIAVACGIGMASIGTDTRASIRVPAALCGVVGLKGTYGLVPTDGIVSLSWTMDHVAPIGATVADAAALLEVMAGRPLGPAPVPEGGLVVGVAEAAFEGCEPSIAAAVRAGIASVAGAGAVVALSRPDAADLDLANAAGLVVSRCEAAAFHRSAEGDRSAYWEETRDQLDAADTVAATDYVDAQRIRGHLAADLLAVFDHCDLLCLPTVGVRPPLRDEATRFLAVLSRLCIPFSLAGFPAVSVPCGVDADGFPVGLQIVGPPGADARVVAAATAVG